MKNVNTPFQFQRLSFLKRKLFNFFLFTMFSISMIPQTFAFSEVATNCNVVVSENSGVISISGLSDNPTLKIFTADYSSVLYQCGPFGGTVCNGTEDITGLPDGDYIVRVISNAPSFCDFTQVIAIGGTGVPKLFLSNFSVSESVGTANVNVCLNFPTTNMVSCNYFTKIGSANNYTSPDGSATENVDYIPAAGILTIPPGELCATIPITIFDDDIDEMDEGFNFNIHSPVGAITSYPIGTVIIKDDDDAIPASCNVDVSVNGGEIVITGLTDNPNLKIFTDGYASVAYECNPWSGNPCGTDQVISNLPDGNYIVRVITDAPSSCDINETVIVQQSTNTPIISLQNNDFLTENAGAYNAVFCLDVISSSDVSVSYTTSDITATSGEDYEFKSGIATIPAGQLCEVYLFPIIDDNIAEPNESFSIDLSNPIGATLGTPNRIVNIGDNDMGACNVSISILAGDIIISGLTDNPNLKIFTDGYGSIAYECNPWNGNSCGGDQVISNLPDGKYIVRILSNFPSSCDISFPVTIGPITLSSTNVLNFNALKNGRQSEISWTMTSDKNIDFYEVEVSPDEMNWTIIKEENSSGIDAPRYYAMVDNKPNEGENFYRMRINYNDGTYEYTKTRRLNFDIDFGEVAVYPNPSSEFINITLRDFSGKSGTVEIYNSFGQKQFQRDYLSFPTIPLGVDISKFVAGIYTISIKVDNHKRFAKQFIVVD